MNRPDRHILLLIILGVSAWIGVAQSGPSSTIENKPQLRASMKNRTKIASPYDHMDVRQMPSAVELTDEQRAYVIEILSAVRRVIEGSAELNVEEETSLGEGQFFWPKDPTKPVKLAKSYFGENFRMGGISLRFERTSEQSPWTIAGLAVHPRNFPSGVFSMRLSPSLFDDFRLKKVAQEQRPDESIQNPIVFYFEHKRLRGVALKVESRDGIVKITDGYPSSFHAIQITRSQVE